MDITSFVVQGRDQALLYGDYSTYHAQLTKRLLNSRKKLGIATQEPWQVPQDGQPSLLKTYGGRKSRVSAS